MREVGLYALIYGVQKTVKKYGYDERDVKNWVIEAFDDPFVVVIRELVKETIAQVGISETSKIFRISCATLQRFSDEFNSKKRREKPEKLITEEWYRNKHFDY
jgi:Asp/Glu/hydantoin racemase